jgi:RNA polymerase sigma-70 factor (ECF subfamily)
MCQIGPREFDRVRRALIPWNEITASNVQWGAPLISEVEMELVRRAAEGDHDAFRQLVLAHEVAIARVVTAMLGPGDDADDVGQETFVRLYRALPSFRGEAGVRTYLTRIAMNLSIDALARRRRWNRVLRFDAESEARQVAAPAPSSLEDEELRSHVRDAVEKLDAKHRAVVVLRILEDRTTRETADILGVPEGTVMSRLKRALEKLQHPLRRFTSP